MAKRVLWTLTTIFIIAAMTLSACKSTPTTTNQTTSVTGSVAPTGTPTNTITSAPSTTAITTTAPVPVNSNEPNYGGTITFVLGHQKATDYFDPIVSAVGGWTASAT
ncbi:MAG: hypothetical protein PHE50_07675, partial [Dehalococcoidales bacterium]|nr:hypothetical protein [Dehalococcoidales bacterium]